jgi:tRNA threonylcarbamoyl adenosine modification protein YeaZ
MEEKRQPGPIMALDTATASMAAAIVDGQEVLAEIQSLAERNHSVHIVANLKELLVRSRLEGQDLAAIAVGSGPGSYTGMRIAVAAAKTLAWIWKKPLVGVSSLEAIAYGAYHQRGESSEEQDTTNNRDQASQQAAGSERDAGELAVSEQQPAAASASEQKPVAVSGSEQKPVAVSANEQKSAVVSANEQKLLTASEGEQKPFAASASEQKSAVVSASEQKFLTASEGEQKPFAASASEQQPAMASASEGRPNVATDEERAEADESMPPAVEWVIPLMDARRGQVYTSAFAMDGSGWIRLADDGVRMMNSWVDRLAEQMQAAGNVQTIRLTGDLSLHEAEAQRLVQLGHTAGVTVKLQPFVLEGRWIAMLGRAKLDAGLTENPHTLVPNYTQLTEAEVNWNAKQAAGGALS